MDQMNKYVRETDFSHYIVMGDDGNEYSDGYCNFEDTVSFKIYDASSNMYINAIASENIPWENMAINIIENVNTDYDWDNDGSDDDDEIVGCMDETACNYNPEAIVSDESCAYEYDCSGICGGDSIDWWDRFRNICRFKA